MININRLVDTFCEMVQIDSESGNEKEFADYIVRIGQELGLPSRHDSFQNVYIDNTSPTGEPLMFHAHMDTAVPGKGIKPIIKDGFIESDGSTVLGADDKAAIAALIEVCESLKENKINHRPFQITLSCNEEVGFPTAVNIRSHIKECIVIDRGSPLGEIITEAPYAQVFEVTVEGKMAYATTSFDQGRHAILAASKIISKIPLGNFTTEATSNIGTIKGGTMTTVVPNSCVFKGNCYSFDPKSLEYFLDQLRAVAKGTDQELGTKTKIELLEYFKGFKLDQNDPLVKQAAAAMEKTGLKPEFKTYKAVTNANNLNDIGIKSVLISYGAENQHTVSERISIKNLEKLAEIIYQAVVL